jgi:uncharacterized protein YaiI (UPF0178 family)
MVVLTWLCAGACPLPEEVDRFCLKKNGQYSVYFVNTFTLRKMNEVGISPVVVDLHVNREASQDELYLQVHFVCRRND